MVKTFSRLDHIGIVSAEDDNLLSDCFIDTGYLTHITNCDDSRIILLGRTGSGKSAIINYLFENRKRTLIINPESLSLSFITNTTMIMELMNAGVHFEMFFKLLWRHVITVEIIRYHCSLNNIREKQKWFQLLSASTSKKKAQRALDYLEKWGNSFWEETDYRVKEITEKFVRELSAKIGIDIASIGSKLCQSDKAKIEIVKKAQNHVNNIQLNELNNILNIVDELLDDDQKKYFVFIDKLDEDWVDNNFRYRLIKSLIETTRDFQRIKNLKVMLALREDLLSRVFEKTRTEGFQKEKYESLCYHIKWSKDHLIELINKRLKKIYSDRGHKANTLRSYLPQSLNNEDPINYIIDRTLMRPRDLISYINIIIRYADSKTSFSAQNVRDAEGEYSLSRLNALSDEWFTDNPNFIRSIELLRHKKDFFSPSDIGDKECENFCLDLLINEIPNNYKIGKIYQIAKQCVDARISIKDFKHKYIIILYEIGLIGLRLHKHERTVFFIDNHRDIQSIDIQVHTMIQVHKAFWRALNIQFEHL